MLKTLSIALIMSAMTPLALPAHASGSMGGGSQGAQLGQKVYMQKIACATCPFPMGLKTRADVDMAKAKINAGEISLSKSEKKAALSFINRRFKEL